jgi:protoporphyrinogen oxidase
MRKKVLVLGGGISGLGVAWKLAENGIPVEIIEAKKDEIGGLAATKVIGPYRLDYGPHFLLSERPKLLEKILALFEEELPVFKRSAQLYFHGRFYNYPLTARNVLMQMPIRDAFFSASSYGTRVVWDLLRKIIHKKKKEPNFEEWARSSFGNYLYKLFFKPYTEQFWQIPCPQLSPDSMPTNTRLSFFKTLRLLFVKDIVRSSMSLVERETTLLLRYPRQGIGEVPRRISEKIKNLNGKIHMGWSVKEVSKNSDRNFSVLASDGSDNRIFKGDHIISTIPLTELVSMIKPIPPGSIRESLKHLGFLSLIVLYIVIHNREILKSSYLYHLARPYNRIGDINKFCPDLSPEEENMLALEFTCHRGDSLWNSSAEDLYEMSINYLEEDGVLHKNEVKKFFVLKDANGYPIYKYEYKPHLQNVLEFIEDMEGIEVLGRAGRYMYMDMDQCLKKGFDLVEQILPTLEKT